MKGCLRSKDGSAVHQLRNTVTTVGRESCDIILPYSTIEKQHALVDFDVSQGCFILQDLNSANGTYVNEHRVQNSAVRLAPGDIIRFGFGNPGYEFGIDQTPSLIYSQTTPQRSWLNGLQTSHYPSGVSLPYISTVLSSMVDSIPAYQGTQSPNLPTAGLSTGEARPADSWGGGVMPHPPLRSRPASAGTVKPRPGSGGRERPPVMLRGGWVENGSAASPNPNGQRSTDELEERLLRMGDELSRLASYEAECHRKDGIINSLRDEVADLKSKVNIQNFGFRAGGEESAFSNVGIVTELRQQVSQLQTMLKEKEQKLTSYQEQLHTRNEELNTLKQQLDTQTQSQKTKVKQDPNGTTNMLASVKTQLAEKDRKIAQLTHDIDKLNKQKMQNTSLMSSLQRENSAKDSVVHQAKLEIDKLKKQLREKDVTISTISAKMTRQKATKEAELEADKKDKELIYSKEKLQSTEKQLKDRTRQVSELQNELDRINGSVSENRQIEFGFSDNVDRESLLYSSFDDNSDTAECSHWYMNESLTMPCMEELLIEENRQIERSLPVYKNDRALQQELDHAKAQFLDANRAEKLLRVDMQQLEKRFDRFRRKAIQSIYSGGKKSPNKELDDDELLDHIKDMAQGNVKLVDEIREYSEAEERTQTQKADLKDAMTTLRKDMESVERHLSKHGCDCKTLEEELMKLEELHTHETLLWIKDVVSRVLTHEVSWQKRCEDTMRRAGVEFDEDDDGDGVPTVEGLCRQLKKQRDQYRQLQAKITEMEETHQDVLLKLREDAKHDEERKIARAIVEVKTAEEEKRHNLMQEMRVKEQERIREAVETERRILESQHGSVTQLQQTLSDKEQELLRHRRALAEAKSQYEQAKNDLVKVKESESSLQTQLQEFVTCHETQLNQVIKEREDLRNYKQEEVASFKEQTRQHARTIVAMEDRLLQLTKQNKQFEMELHYNKQGVRHRPLSPRKERPPSPKKETSARPQSPKKEPKQTRSVETETIPQTNVEASLKSDLYKLEQLVLLLRREASNAKMEAQAQSDVVQALRRDLAGASARMSDMAGELSDKQKQKLEDNEDRIREQDRELDEQRKQLMQLSLLVDEQQKQIDVREDKLSSHEHKVVKHQKESVRKNLQLVEYTDQLEKTLEDQAEQMDQVEKENKSSSDLYKVGLRCRGERHDQVIVRQKEALVDLRKKTKVMEQLKPPLPNHEQSLQQIVALKSELSELRASIANKEEDYHKSESEMHSEVAHSHTSRSGSQTVIDSQSTASRQEVVYNNILSSGSKLRILRETSSSNLMETNFEKSTHKDTHNTLDLSEKTYLKLARTLAALLEVDPLPGGRSMAYLPVEERERLELERDKALELMVNRVNRLQERLDRKEKLLGGYEDDLVHLRETQSVAGQKTAEAKGLKIDVRDRQEEIAYLRESLSRTRDDLDQQRRLNKCLRERKKFAMDCEDRDHQSTAHSCYQDEFSRYQDEKKKKKSTEKIKRKNYEIESLKKELRSADRELNNTALKLQAIESSRSIHSIHDDIPTLELNGV